MDRLRIIYHPAKAPDRTGQVVATDPVVLGSDPDFAIRWIRRRLGLRPRGVFPLTTRYGPDILPLRDPAAMITTDPAADRPTRPDLDHVPVPTIPSGPEATPTNGSETDNGAALPMMANTQINEPESSLPISAASADETSNGTLPVVPVLDDER